MILNILFFIYSFMFCLPISFCPAKANCLSLGEINSSQLVLLWVRSLILKECPYLPCAVRAAFTRSGLESKIYYNFTAKTRILYLSS
jgi:hypothetical protein